MDPKTIICCKVRSEEERQPCAVNQQIGGTGSDRQAYDHERNKKEIE